MFACTPNSVAPPPVMLCVWWEKLLLLPAGPGDIAVLAFFTIQSGWERVRARPGPNQGSSDVIFIIPHSLRQWTDDESFISVQQQQQQSPAAQSVLLLSFYARSFTEARIPRGHNFSWNCHFGWKFLGPGKLFSAQSSCPDTAPATQ